MGVKLGLTFCEECRVRVFENMVLRKIFGSKRDNKQKIGKDYIMGSFMIYTTEEILFRRSNQEE